MKSREQLHRQRILYRHKRVSRQRAPVLKTLEAEFSSALTAKLSTQKPLTFLPIVVKQKISLDTEKIL